MAEDDSEDQHNPFELQHTDEKLLEYIRHEEVVTTKEIADHFDYHLQTARRRLKELEQEGELHKKDSGKRLVWWIPRDTNEAD
jgi:predicted HTH transcriptional regulator